MNPVYVLNKNGQALMPTYRFCAVRKKLKAGKAKVVNYNPFTIQLTYDSPGITQPLILGIDPGRTNIGVAVVNESGTAVFEANVETRNKEIPKLMAERKAKRQYRRSAKRRKKRMRRAKKHNTLSKKCVNTKPADTNISDKNVNIGVITRYLKSCDKPIHYVGIKGKEARFNNRTRPKGWLTPTANQLLQTHLNVVNTIQRFLPIKKVVLEINKFTFMELDNPDIKNWEYAKGPLYGFNNIKDYISQQQEDKCLLCGGVIEHYHHIIPKHLGGSDTINNIVGLCNSCHHEVHTNIVIKDKLDSLKSGLKKRYNALSIVNQIISALINSLADKFKTDFSVTDGKTTSESRIKFNLKKDHHIDACCIAASVLEDISDINCNKYVYNIKQFRRHDRQCLHQARVNRNYYKDGTLVAVNRHKAIEQIADSLEEYRFKTGDVHCSTLTTKPHNPIFKNRNRVMPGAIIQHDDIYFVLKGSNGSNKKTGLSIYYVDLLGQKHLVSKCNVIKNNQGLVCIKI